MKIILMGGPYSGKSTSHRNGLGLDPEETPFWKERKKALKDGPVNVRRDAYNKYTSAIVNDELNPVVLVHFSARIATDAIKRGWKVGIIIPPGDELRRRMLEDRNIERIVSACEQLSSVARWYDGPYAKNTPLFDNYDQAFEGLS